MMLAMAEIPSMKSAKYIMYNTEIIPAKHKIPKMMSAKNIIPKEMQVKTLRNPARNIEVFARAQIPTGGLSSVAPFVNCNHPKSKRTR